MPRDLEYWKRLEVESRKGLSSALHPDQCPKLRIKGADFAIPPRGTSIQAVFDDEGEVRFAEAATEEWPEADRLIELAPVEEGEVCEACERPLEPKLAIDLEASGEFLKLAYTLAGKLLTRQYNFAPAQLSELLSLDNEKPDWIGQLLGWSLGA